MGQQVNEYQVVRDHDEKMLSGKVNKLLAEGWVLHGGLCCASAATVQGSGGSAIFCQALVKSAICQAGAV